MIYSPELLSLIDLLISNEKSNIDLAFSLAESQKISLKPFSDDVWNYAKATNSKSSLYDKTFVDFLSKFSRPSIFLKLESYKKIPLRLFQFFSASKIAANNCDLSDLQASYILKNLSKGVIVLRLNKNLLKEIPKVEMPNVKNLLVSENLIETLEDISKYFPNIESLDLSGNPIKSLKGIERLQSLKFLGLDDIDIDVSILEECQYLEEISLIGQRFQNFESLKSLKGSSVKFIQLSCFESIPFETLMYFENTIEFIIQSSEEVLNQTLEKMGIKLEFEFFRRSEL